MNWNTSLTNYRICLDKCPSCKMTTAWEGWHTTTCVKPDYTNLNRHHLIGDLHENKIWFKPDERFIRPAACPYELEHTLLDEQDKDNLNRWEAGIR